MFSLKNKKAFSLLEIIIAMAILALLAAIAVPNFIKANKAMKADKCIENLKQISAAKEQLALDKNYSIATLCTEEDLDPYIKGGLKNLICPSDASKSFKTSYKINKIGIAPECTVLPEEHKI